MPFSWPRIHVDHALKNACIRFATVSGAKSAQTKKPNRCRKQLTETSRVLLIKMARTALQYGLNNAEGYLTDNLVKKLNQHVPAHVKKQAVLEWSRPKASGAS